MNAFGASAKTDTLQSFKEVKKSFFPSDVMIIDRNGLSFERVRIDSSERSLPWVSINQISFAFKKILIKSEDRRFYEHAGVDWLALIKAGAQHFTNNTKRGASTLSMQLVGLLDSNVKRHRRSFWDKFGQIEKAIYLEKNWSKDEILEAYINLVAFRGELVGLNAASMGFFHIAPSALNNEQSALLVALLRSPNADAVLVGKRACQLLETKDCSQIQKLSLDNFTNNYEIKRPRKWIAILDSSFLKTSYSNKAKSELLKTTLDQHIQKKAVESLQEQIRFFKKQNLSDGAILVLDNKTGEVLTYVANAGESFSPAPLVDGIRAKRQAGSTLKPFVYATAIDLNLIHQNSLIDDSPLDIPIGKGSIYYPRNYDNSFKGLVNAGEALGSSLNVPAVKTLQVIGGERIITKMKKLGFTDLLDADYYGPSLALGSVDVSLWDLTHAYLKLGRSNIFSKKTKNEIFAMLSTDENRRHTFGTGSILKLPFLAAVKTGTSKDMRDNWCVGFSSRYKVGVWVGNFDGKAMWNVSGVTGAAPLWRAVMLELHQNLKGFKNLTENYLAVNSDEITPARITDQTISSIRYPVDNEIVGLDPEIPSRLQKMPIEIINPQKGLKLKLDDKFFKDSTSLTMWNVEMGKHHLELLDNQEKVIDEVRFEVR